jgi:hypothetical protein
MAGGVKQLTVPLLPDPNCSMLESDAQCVIPVKRTSDHSVNKMLYFFQNNVVPQFFNGMVC